jgi:hypothetical protein
MSMQQWNEDDDFFNRLIFGDNSTFHLSGKVNKHNVHIWGTENPRELVQYSPEVNVFCAVSRTKVYGLFPPPPPHGNIVTVTYLVMFSEWLLPQIKQDSENFTFIQDGAPPHWHSGVRHYLAENLPRHWIGRSTDENMAVTCWPPRTPDLTPCDSFLWGYIKNRVFVPPFQVSLNELKQCITTAVASVDKDMLRSVWTELDYRIDICSVTKGSLTHRTFVTSLYELKTCTTKPCILAKS